MPRKHAKTLLETALLEWRAARDALLDAYIFNTANTYYPKWFVRRIVDITKGFRTLKNGVNLDIMNPTIVARTSNIFDEIVALNRLVGVMPHLVSEQNDGKGKAISAFWDGDDFDPEAWIDDDDHDPYGEDIYYFDDTDESSLVLQLS